MKNFIQFLLLSLIVLFVFNCARKGRPTGGPKDETAPLLVTANPPDKTIKFNKNEIKIYFDEFIILKDLNAQLVVSPPMKNPPLITPQGTPSKHITIKILDALRPNTTYTFNFGNAVQDNNEGNTLEAFKYVFSTGNYIDSLTLQGNIKDAFKQEMAKNISALLYKIDSNFTDSIIYKEKPLYVTTLLDSSTYKFTNLQQGKYLLLALEETNKDYIFNPKTDKIAFVLDTIVLPKDSVSTKDLRLFKELETYKFRRGKEVSKGKIQFSFNGEKEPLQVTVLSKVPNNFTSFYQLEKNKDTLNYWHTPLIKDSLVVSITNKNIIDTATVFLRKKNIDSLTISTSTNNILNLKDTLFFYTNNPLIKIDTTKFSIIDKDSLSVNYTIKKNTINTYALLFTKKPSDTYKIKVLPEAFTDLYNTKNTDTLQYNLRTKAKDDYGSIILDVANKTKLPIIIELLADKDVLERQYFTESKKISFTLINPNTYTIRAIVDTNNNKKWDTGNFLKKIQPEKVIYFDNEIKLRANWVITEVFTIAN